MNLEHGEEHRMIFVNTGLHRVKDDKVKLGRVKLDKVKLDRVKVDKFTLRKSTTTHQTEGQNKTMQRKLSSSSNL